MRRRNICIPFRLNEQEFAELDAKVKKSGLTRESFLRKMIAEKRVFEAPPVDFLTQISSHNPWNIGKAITETRKSGFKKRGVFAA